MINGHCGEWEMMDGKWEMTKRKQNKRFADKMLGIWRINYTTLLRFFTFSPVCQKRHFRRSKVPLLMINRAAFERRKWPFHFVICYKPRAL